MLFLGHIATSVVIADAMGSERTAAVAGGLIPDVTDKTLAWVLKLTPGRWFFHGLPVFFVVAMLSRMILPEARWRAFVSGYAAHLVCDLWAGGRVPWLAPWGPKPVKRLGKKPIWFWMVYLLPEAVGAAVLWQKSHTPAGRGPLSP